MKKSISLVLILFFISISVSSGSIQQNYEIVIKPYNSINDIELDAIYRAIQFWEGYDPSVDFTYYDETKKPDIIIVFKENVKRCGVEESKDIIGCAPKLDMRENYRNNVALVQVERLKSEEMVFVVAHELGHTLGKGHGDDPKFLMGPSVKVSD